MAFAALAPFLPALLPAATSILGGGRVSGGDRQTTPQGGSPGLSLPSLGGLPLPGLGGGGGGLPDIGGIADLAGGLVGGIGSAFGIGGNKKVRRLKQELLKARASKDVSDAKKLLLRKQGRVARSALFQTTGDTSVLKARQLQRLRQKGSLNPNALAAARGTANIPAELLAQVTASMSGNQQKQKQLALQMLAQRSGSAAPALRQRFTATQSAFPAASLASFTPGGASMAVGVRSPFRGGQLVSAGGFVSPLDAQGFTNPFRGIFDTLFGGPPTPFGQALEGAFGLDDASQQASLLRCPTDAPMFKDPTTLNSARANSLVARVNPMTGKLHYWRHVGQPVLFSGDLGQCRRVGKIASKAQRGMPTRRSSARRGRR